LFQSRVQILDIPIRRTQQQEWIPMERELYDDGRQSRLQLVSTKIYSDPTASFGVYSKPKVLRCMYLAETFPGCQTVSAEQELRKIANFAALDTRKAMARLELLQSPAYVVPATARTDKKHGIFFFPNALDICTRMEDPGCVGCGFIAESLLMEMFHSLGKKTLAKKVYAIQVRLLVPTMGIYKGMLCRKRISHGPPIQLPDSMWKVPPSTSPDASIGAALLICRSGVHPKTGTTNYYIGRRLDENAKCPLHVRSFQPKPLSDMILRLFQALQVHPVTIRNYRAQSITREGVNHAWLIGLADPTDSLPVGHVYVTGSGFQVSSGRVFVTRSPCMKPTDGRILPVVHQKPDRMSHEDWNTIQAFPFGGIIFAYPKKRGIRPIPEYIANGDLDGDLYFTCWDRTILQEIQAEPIPQEPDLSSSSSSSNPPVVIHQQQQHSLNWFRDVQTLMMNVPLLLAMDELTSKCYRLSQTIADQHPDLFMGHPDAIAFASAYNQALEYAKHGGQIYLPKHLHNLLPQHLLPHVTDQMT
jgi:RNA dependent RNA polymerase